MSEPLHIVVINVFFAPHTYGGATHVAEQVSRALMSRHNVRVTAISVMSRAEYAPYAVMKAESHGIVNHIINLPAGRTTEEMYANPKVADRIVAIVRDISPDLAHVHCIQDIGANVLGRLRDLSVPIVLSVHDFWWLCERQFMIRPDGRYCGQDPIDIDACNGCVADFSKSKCRHEYLLAQAELADLVTYPSRFAQRLCESSGLARGKGVVLENGILPPAPDFAARQAARRARNPQIAFAFVGGPSPIKGWPIIQDAFRSLDRDDFCGYLVDASLDRSWYTPPKYEGMKGHWEVHPRYDSSSIDDFYAKVDVLLFLSQWKETFGLTIREALSRGILVVQTDGGGTIEHAAGDRVRMLKIGDGPKRLKAEIERILDNPSVVRVDPQPVATYAEQADSMMMYLAAHRLLPAGYLRREASR